MNRVINALSHLERILKNGDEFIIGFGSKSLTTVGLLYSGLIELIDGNISDLLVQGKKGPLKENVHGKFVRKQPEIKKVINRHIEYTRKNGGKISYDRDFEVWERQMLHKYNLKLKRGTSPQGEIILYFDPLVFDSTNESYLNMAKSAMNICIILGGYFQLYDYKLEPIVKVTATLDKKILSKGTGSVNSKLEELKKEFFGENSKLDNSGNSYRFSVLQEFKVTDIYDGEGGFNEYFHFEFADDNIVLLENLRSGNASYIFDLKKYDINFALDKSNAIRHPAFLKRIIHYNLDNWRSVLMSYLSLRDESNL